MEPSEVSALLGVPPSPSVRPSGHWSLRVEPEDELELVTSLCSLLDQLADSPQGVERLKELGATFDLFCFVGSEATEHAAILPPDLLGRIAALGAELWLDVYPSDARFPGPPDRDGLVDVLLQVRQRPGMWLVRTHRELATFLVGVGAGSDLLRDRDVYEWMLSLDDPKWGGRGGVGWTTRAAAAVVPGYHERVGTGFTDEEEGLMRDAIIIDVALAWLRRPEAG